MFKNIGSRLPVILSSLFLLLVGASNALADQVTLSYIDASSSPQIIMLDTNSSTEDLALAASLVGENGVSIVNNPDAGSGSLADIAAAMAFAAPVFAANVAQAFSIMSPEETEEIVAAVNEVSGVNTEAVLAAVTFGPLNTVVGPQAIGSDTAISVDLTEPEHIPSGN